MATFITGASGYIGSNLAATIANRGEQVHAMYHSSPPEYLKNIPNITLFQGDVMDCNSLEKAMKGCRKVYHLAAFANNWASDNAIFYRINVGGTVNVLDTALKLGIQKVVYTSSAGTIGPQTNNKPIDETTKSTWQQLTRYGITKLIAEKKARKYTARGLDVVIVNPTRVFGPGLMSKSNVGTQLIRLYVEGKWHVIPGDGSAIGNYAFIEDVVNGHLLAMQKGHPGERYILGGHNLSYDAFFQKLSQAAGQQFWMMKFPLWLMLGIAKAMQIFARLTGTHPLITPPWVKKYIENWETDCSKAVNELGYTITPIEKAFEKTIQWIRGGVTEPVPEITPKEI